MSKTMCERSEKEKSEKRVDAVYFCKKCSETAKKEKHLCKPKKIKENKEE